VEGASPDERKAIEEKLAARRPDLKNPRTAAELRHYLAHLDRLPGAGDVRLALASYLIDHDRPQEAEIELLESLASSDPSSHPGQRSYWQNSRQRRGSKPAGRLHTGRADMWTLRSSRQLPRSRS